VKAFQALDTDQDGVITSHEIVNFMKQNFLRVSEEDATLIIKEYDANNDENLDFEEFTRLALPSTNQALKEIAINRSSSSY
jgi:Ca2+-binding EF-hand superfamily protein